jgi:hypothetical protein
MIILSIIGFIAIVILALYFTAAAISIVYGEMIFGGITPASFIISAVAVGLWVLAFWLSPFTVTLRGAA